MPTSDLLSLTTSSEKFAPKEKGIIVCMMQELKKFLLKVVFIKHYLFDSMMYNLLLEEW